MKLAPIKKLASQVPDWVPAISVAPYADKVALIVEPRAHPNLAPVILQMAHLYPEWLVYLYHGTDNLAFILADPDLTYLRDAGRLVLFPLNVANLNSDMYNAIFISRLFWDTVNAAHALVFQTDVWLCDSPATPLDEFLGYDYVGSPRSFPFMPKLYNFMNGGFSLRNVAAMKRVVEHCRFPDVFGYVGEDVFFSKPCKAAGLTMPTLEKAAEFGVQQGSFYRERVPVGAHKPYFAYGVPDLEELETHCKGVLGMAQRNGKS
jgi:hypothetical protein